MKNILKSFSAAAVLAALTVTSAFASAEVGQAAPDFTLTDVTGKTHKLSDYRGKTVVLWFYPKADTPGCTAQACAFRDSIKVIRAEGAEVYGISTDTVESQAAFHEKHRLAFPLLADPDRHMVRPR